MTRVFVSYSSEDSYFVDFLIELLDYHHIDVWADRNDLHAGATFTSDIEQALIACDNLIAVISHHSSRSRWMTREISTFKAVNPERVVIPLVLDAEADADEIYDGLGLVQHLRCYESFLQSFRELLQLLGKTLFPDVERRETLDRRFEEDRRAGDNRRASSIEERLWIGILVGYTQHFNKGELEPLRKATDVGHLARYLADPGSPLHSYNFISRRTGHEGPPELDALESLAYASWRSKAKEQLTGAAYIVEHIVKGLAADYVITPKDRRTEQRRSDIPRRRNAGPSM